MSTQTIETEFLVKRIQRSHVWVKVLHGDDEGITVSVARYHEDYDASQRHTIESLSNGDVVEASLVTETPENPTWRFKSVTITD